MAIKKAIEQENGVILNYHRIVSINKITNISTIIEVASYTNEQKRQEEKEALENKVEMNVYIETKYIDMQYSENTTIDQAYAYLKTTEPFKDSEDII